MFTSLRISTACACASLRDAPSCTIGTSMSWNPTGMLGFSALIGSWYTMAIFAPRMRRSSAGEREAMSCPSNCTRPRTIRPLRPR